MSVSLTPAVIDQASNRILLIWKTLRNIDGPQKEPEGLHSWVLRMAEQAVTTGDLLPSGKLRYMGMKFGFITVSDPNGLYYSLTSIERVK